MSSNRTTQQLCRLLGSRWGVRTLGSAARGAEQPLCSCVQRSSPAAAHSDPPLRGPQQRTQGPACWRGFASAAGQGGPGPAGKGSSSSGDGSESSPSTKSGDDRAAAAATPERGPEADPAAGVPPSVGDPFTDALRLSRLPGNPYGLPPLEQILSFDREGELKQQRRDMERVKQEQITQARVRQVDDQGRAYATGKRKEAIARVWLSAGDGRIQINGRALDAYFPHMTWRVHVLYPFIVTDTLGAFNLHATVEGGGPSGQAQALRHGLAKALQAWEPEHRASLRAQGLLTRDSRVVERKKPGKAKARKSFQWVKR